MEREGRLTVIMGPTQSGKSTRLQEVLTGYEKGDPPVILRAVREIVTPPSTETFGQGGIPIFPIEGMADLRKVLAGKHSEALGFDDFHLAPIHFIQLVKGFLAKGQDLYVSGQDYDFRGRGFWWETMKALLYIPANIEERTAACSLPWCPKTATLTQRFVNGQYALFDTPVLPLGSEKDYQPRCEKHHQVNAPKEHTFKRSLVVPGV